MGARISVLTLLTAVCCTALGDDVLRRIDGTYEMPSECTTLNAKGEHEPCGPEVRDRLTIRRLSDKTAEVELFSVQINGHTCEVSGISQLQGDSLFYLEPNIQKESPGQGLRIRITSSDLVLDTIEPLANRDPFCGTRAYVSRLKFPFSARVR